MRIFRQCNQRLTGTVTGNQTLNVQTSRSPHPTPSAASLVIAFHQHMLHGRPGGSVSLPVSGSRLCPRADGSVRSIAAAPGGINKHHRLIALTFTAGFKAVARFIVKPRRINIMTFWRCAPSPSATSTIVTGSTVAWSCSSSLSFCAHAAENGDRRHRHGICS